MSTLTHEHLGGASRPLGALSRITVDRWRRALQLALAAVWLADAALQCQPFMFGRGFAGEVIEPAAQGNPAPVARPELWAAHVIASHPVLLNALFATVQLALAIGLVSRRTVRPALAASVAWSLGVWWFGEGLGGVLAGSDPVAGAPGPALLYALLALLLWPAAEDDGSVAGSSVARRAAAGMWAVLCACVAVTALRLDPGTARIALALGPALLVVAPLLPRPGARIAFALAAVGSAALWWLGQGFGDPLSGSSTDPNSGPLFALLALAYWPLSGTRRTTLPDAAAARSAGRQRRPRHRG